MLRIINLKSRHVILHDTKHPSKLPKSKFLLQANQPTNRLSPFKEVEAIIPLDN